MIMIETVMFFYYFPNSVNSILTLPAPPSPVPKHKQHIGQFYLFNFSHKNSTVCQFRMSMSLLNKLATYCTNNFLLHSTLDIRSLTRRGV